MNPWGSSSGHPLIPGGMFGPRNGLFCALAKTERVRMMGSYKMYMHVPLEYSNTTTQCPSFSVIILRL